MVGVRWGREGSEWSEAEVFGKNKFRSESRVKLENQIEKHRSEAGKTRQGKSTLETSC